MKLMVIPVGRSLVFSGSQAKNISYSIDHRHKIFRTLSITGKKYVFYRKDISVSTSWWEVANHIRYGIRFTVRILGGITHYLSLIPLTLERSKDRLSLEPWIWR